jgi:hypothetical protein
MAGGVAEAGHLGFLRGQVLDRVEDQVGQREGAVSSMAGPYRSPGAWPKALITPDPGVQRVELYVADATRAVPPDKVRDIVMALTAS